MDDEGLGVSDVGDKRKKFEAVDELLSGFIAALDAKGYEGAVAVWKILLRAGVVGAGFEAGVVDPFNAGMLLEMAGDGEGVFRSGAGGGGGGFQCPAVKGMH